MSLTRVQKLNYALTICDAETPQYTQEHKNAALAYLIKTLNINRNLPKRLTDKEIIKNIKEKKLIVGDANNTNSTLITKTTQASTPNGSDSTLAPKERNVALKRLTLIENSQNPYQEQIGDFILATNKNIQQINTLIDKYNQEKNQAERLATLREIYKKRQDMNNKCSESQILACPDYYHIIEKELFPQLQQQFHMIGVGSMRNVFENSLEPSVLQHQSLPELIANMAPEKLQLLFNHLMNFSDRNWKSLKELYKTGEVGRDEFVTFIDKP